MTIYLDLYFALNFVMDYLLLLLTGWMLLLPIGKRVCVAAAFGAGSACVFMFLPQNWMAGHTGMAALILLETAVSGAMVRIAYGNHGGKILSGEVLTLWMFSIMTGGIFEAMEQQMSLSAGSPTGSATDPVGIWTPIRILMMAVGIAAAGRIIIGRGRAWVRLQRKICSVRLRFQGKEQMLNALWDTGNQLFEPYGHQPVHVIDYEVCKDWLGTTSKVILIPFSSVGKESGMLPGIQIDEMDVIREGQVFRHYDKPWLAVSRKHLSHENRYEMLLHGD